MSGLVRLKWQSDTVVLAMADQADEQLCQLADVIVQPAQATLAEADALAQHTARTLPGCAVVVIGIRDQGCLVHNTSAHLSVMIPGCGTRLEALCCGVLGYLTAGQPALS